MKKNKVIIGMPGSGKSTIGNLLSKELSINFIDMDAYIEQDENKTIKEMFDISESFFRDVETRCSNKLSKLNFHVIATGGGIVKRKENIDYLKENSIIIFIDRPVENILKDIDIDSRPLLKGEREKVYKLYNERINLYKEYCHVEIKNTGEISETLNKIIDQLKIIDEI